MTSNDNGAGSAGDQVEGGVAAAERAARIRQDAASWFARLRDGDPANQSAFEAWFAADPAHADAYERLLAGWAKTAQDAETVGLVSPVRKGSRWTKRIALGVAAVIILGGAGWFVAERLDGPRRGAITSPRDALRAVKLADGSQLTLDANSTVVPKFTGTERQLRLTHGRVRFATVSDHRRPLKVKTVLGTIAADGAIFDVSLAATTATVTVWQGAVTVTYKRAKDAAPLTIAGPSSLTFNGHGVIYAPEPPAVGAGAWAQSARPVVTRTPPDVAPVRHPDAGGGKSVH